MAGVYDVHDYLEERRDALSQWAAVLSSVEEDGKVVPIRQHKTGDRAQ
jgi:hypothetical protein